MKRGDTSKQQAVFPRVAEQAAYLLQNGHHINALESHYIQ
jgi:hypothetical protein